MIAEIQFQRNLQQAINYESIKSTIQKSSINILESLKEIEDEIPLYEPLSLYLKRYSELFDLSADSLLQNYLHIKGKFLKLDQNDLVLKIGDPYYPQTISNYDSNFPFLYLRGDYKLLGNCVSVVGSSNASAEGLNYTKSSVSTLIKNKINPLSILDYGVATTLYLTAFEQQAKAVSVLSTPLNEYSKSIFETLQNEIAKKGLLVSFISPAEESKNWHLALRNQLVAHLSKAVIISEEYDGRTAVRIASYALEQQKKVIFYNHILKNRSLLWPRKFSNNKGVSIINNAGQIKDILVDKKRVLDSEKAKYNQLSLFELA